MHQDAPRSSQHRLTVLRTRALTPLLRRVTLFAPTLAGLALRPAQDVGLMLTDDAGRPVRKRYTIRNVDPHALTIDLDAILHGHGPGARWFAAAQPGESVEAIGPRGQVELADRDWHLFVGDESGLPAFAELLAALPPTATARALIEIAGPAEELDLPSAAGDVRVTWVHRGEHPVGTSELLTQAVRATKLPTSAELPTGQGQAYLLGESRAVVALRPVLAERGLVGPQVFLKGYWNRTGRVRS